MLFGLTHRLASTIAAVTGRPSGADRPRYGSHAVGQQDPYIRSKVRKSTSTRSSGRDVRRSKYRAWLWELVKDVSRKIDSLYLSGIIDEIAIALARSQLLSGIRVLPSATVGLGLVVDSQVVVGPGSRRVNLAYQKNDEDEDL